MKKVHSFYDTKNKLYVDCTECNRGFFGLDKDKCSAGQKYKIGEFGGCFIGDLIEGIEVKKE